MSTPVVKIDLEKCFVDWYDIDFGQRVYVCRSRQHPCPLGMVWGKQNWSSKRLTYFEVQGSYIMHWARRRGIRSLINDQILKHFKAVTSQGATPDGQAFMKKTGYRANPLLGWVKTGRKK